MKKMTSHFRLLSFSVLGVPIPKQSFKVSKRAKGGGYTPSGPKSWQELVLSRFKEAGLLAYFPEGGLDGAAFVVGSLFVLPSRHAKDLDNLSKSSLDALNKFAWVDDKQVGSMLLHKVFIEGQGSLTMYIAILKKDILEAHLAAVTEITERLYNDRSILESL